ncbi:metal-dependent hydrolase [bacterium]|nr:metal-dependent hydrolase [bacterium]
MAMFREHIAWGAIVAMVVVVALYSYALVTDIALLVFLFGVTVIGSFLPDTDSDSSMPFYLVFGAMTLAVTTVVTFYTLASAYATDWRYLVGIPGASLVFFWVVVGGIIKRLTHHRGMFHSLPALGIAAVGTFLLAKHYGFSQEVALYFGGAMAAGFFTHLILDEIYAGITLDGVLFNPKSTFGGATKLFGTSAPVNTATYTLLATLIYVALR